jgi:hypothetical protein
MAEVITGGAQDRKLKALKERFSQVQVKEAALSLPAGKAHPGEPLDFERTTDHLSISAVQVPANTTLKYAVEAVAVLILVLVAYITIGIYFWTTVSGTFSKVDSTLSRSIATTDVVRP